MNKEKLQILESEAIDAAISSNWKQAIELNLQILKAKKTDIGALLRLGFAYLQTDAFKSSLETYEKVLHLQPKNVIAQEYIEKIKVRRTQKGTKAAQVTFDTNAFIELPGKTKTVVLGQLGQKTVLANLSVGQKVSLAVRKHKVEVRTTDDAYVGVLPDDVGVRLMYFIQHKSVYEVFVREATLNTVSVFVREVSKGAKVEKLASFPLDIPGSISKVMAKKQEDEEMQELIKKNAESEDGEDTLTAGQDGELEEEEEEKEDDLESGFLKEIEDDKPDTEILGIETDEEEEEE